MNMENERRRPAISVVLPAYNEEEALPVAAELYLEAFRAAGMEGFEILIVNDGSGDGTGRIADDLAHSDPRIRVIHHERNEGHMVACLHGFRKARGRVITWNGADVPFHPRDVERMLDEIRQGADVVVVERSNRSAYGIVRKIVSWSNVLILRALFGSPFHDHNFVQFFRREVLESMPIVSTGPSTMTAEMIFRAMRTGWRVVPATAEYHRRTLGKSTITASIAVKALAETFELWRQMRAERRQQRSDTRPARAAGGPPGAGSRTIAEGDTKPWQRPRKNSGWRAVANRACCLSCLRSRS